MYCCHVLCEGGAMGCPGEIVIVTFDQQIFTLNQCYDDLDKYIYKICPELKECYFGYKIPKKPVSWKYYNLGFGNHLIISGRVWRNFDRAKGNDVDCVELYQNWLDILLSVLKKTPDSMRAFRIRVFKETVKIVNKGFYVLYNGERISFPTDKDSQENKTSIKSIFYDKEFRIVPASTTKNKTKIIVENTDCLIAGHNLQQKNYNVAVLNMVSRKIPGGGVINGAGAQEENLFRRSNLFQSMYQYASFSLKYGVEPSHQQYPLDRNFGGVYTKNATVFRDEEKMDTNC